MKESRSKTRYSKNQNSRHSQISRVLDHDCVLLWGNLTSHYILKMRAGGSQSGLMALRLELIFFLTEIELIYNIVLGFSSTSKWFGDICIYAYVRANLLQLCPTLCNPMDCSLPGSSVHGTLQARILEWVAIPSSRGSSQPSGLASISWVSCWQTSSLPLAPPGKLYMYMGSHRASLVAQLVMNLPAMQET